MLTILVEQQCSMHGTGTWWFVSVWTCVFTFTIYHLQCKTITCHQQKFWKDNLTRGDHTMYEWNTSDYTPERQVIPYLKHCFKQMIYSDHIDWQTSYPNPFCMLAANYSVAYRTDLHIPHTLIQTKETSIHCGFTCPNKTQRILNVTSHTLMWENVQALHKLDQLTKYLVHERSK